jgi:hypothetical protein
VELRVSDAERDAAAALLQEHCAAGRLTVEELAERVELAYRAVTTADLDRLLADLPAAPAPPTPQPETRVRHELPVARGGEAFTERLVLPSSRGHVLAQTLARLAPLLNGRGYALESYTPHTLEFVHDRRPGWTIAVAILGFPIGLAALLYRQRSRIVLTLEEAPSGGTVLTVYGNAPRAVRRAFAELRDA